MPMKSFHAAAVAAALAVPALLPAQAPAPAERRPADSVRLVTSDIPNFWRAYDLAVGKDSAERVRIFREVYLEPGSAGLYDWARVRLMNRKVVAERLAAAGLPATARDSAAGRSFVLHSAAEGLVAAIEMFPKYYAGIRPLSLAVDTSEVVTGTIRLGLRRLTELYPEARFPDVYFLIGNLSTGGTVAGAGMLIGTEQYSSTPDTPTDGLPPWFSEILAMNTFDRLGGLVVHEAVHSLQTGRDSSNLLEQALLEGVADFVSELAVGPWHEGTPRMVYGKANEAAVWHDFEDEMATDSTLRTWMYNGSVPFPENHGAVDIGYWVGYAIAREYYRRAPDKTVAIRDLIELKDAEELLERSRYREYVQELEISGPRLE